MTEPFDHQAYKLPYLSEQQFAALRIMIVAADAGKSVYTGKAHDPVRRVVAGLTAGVLARRGFAEYKRHTPTQGREVAITDAGRDLYLDHKEARADHARRMADAEVTG